jgi:hypothetical protein
MDDTRVKITIREMVTVTQFMRIGVKGGSNQGQVKVPTPQAIVAWCGR